MARGGFSFEYVVYMVGQQPPRVPRPGQVRAFMRNLLLDIRALNRLRVS